MAAAEVTNFSLECVQKSLAEGKPIKALGYLLIVTNLDGSLKTELRPVLLLLLGDLSKRLATDRRYDDLMKCYEEVLGVYTNDEVVLDTIGSYLYRFSHLKESRRYFQLAHSINSEYLPAWRNLQNVTNALLERWHFRMLNDSRRNEAFRKAILRTVGKGAKTVIDIGTGTGLLSLYCKIAGAHFICACDYSSLMTSIASNVFDTNLSPNSINVVNKLSTDMTIPQDLPFRCSLVVTETMDSGLLGEHLLRTLDHAWKHLLLPPAANTTRVIPSSATLFAAPIESLKVAKKNWILSSDRLYCGHALPYEIPVRPSKSEPYDTENLVNSCCRYLADPIKLFSFNFNDPCEIELWLISEVVETAQVSISISGHLDAIAMWFEAHLDEELRITTSPLSFRRCSAWHQAIFPCVPTRVSENTKIQLNYKCSRGVVDVSVNSEHVEDDSAVFLDTSVISFLNARSYLAALEIAFEKSRHSVVNVSRVIDMSVFPHLGVILSKRFKCKLLAINDIPGDSFKSLMNHCEVESHLITHKAVSDVGNNEQSYCNLLIANFVETTGEMSPDMLRASEYIIEACLVPNALIFPNKTEIWARLVECPQLVNENKVNNPTIDGEFDLSQYINEYSVSTHIDLCVEDFDVKHLSKPFLVTSIPMMSMFSKHPTSWESVVPCTADGALHAVIYWFQFVLYDDVIFSTSSPDSYMNQVAEVLPSEIQISKSDTMLVKCFYNYGILRLTAQKK